MTNVVTSGIMLSRLNYGEADKIITIITPDHGKVRVMARGVRKLKSKLAGGVELFSVSNITYIPGKKDISTLVSTRLQTHYNHIVESIDRTMLGYDIIKILHKATDDECGPEYYELLLKTLADLNDQEISPLLTKCWFMAQLLRILGHTPNIRSDTHGDKLKQDKLYQFDYQDMGFYENQKGTLTADHIKMLRLLVQEEPAKLHIIKGLDMVLPSLEQLLRQSITLFVSGI